VLYNGGSYSVVAWLDVTFRTYARSHDDMGHHRIDTSKETGICMVQSVIECHALQQVGTAVPCPM
jgi:hypothetical protein